MKRFTAGCTALALLSTGCLEREERITVKPDGAIEMTVTFDADSFNELYLDDGVPAVDMNWLIEEWTESDADDNERFRMKAAQSFAPGEELPTRYGRLDDPFRDILLHFTTTLDIDDRRDGTYHHFRRVYPARAWAYLQTPRDQMEEHIKKKVGDSEYHELARGDQIAILEAVARFELIKFMTFARRAFLDVSPEAPQDVWLHVYAALPPLLEEIDFARFAELLLADEETHPEAGRVLEEESAKFEEKMLLTLREALGKSGWYPSSILNQFDHRFKQHKKEYEISGDLSDDKFTIIVEMPGEIVAHNADEVRGRKAIWKFAGSMMHDRELELMVTSHRP